MPTDSRGIPGVSAGRSLVFRNIFVQNAANQVTYAPQMGTIGGASSRDPESVPVSLLRAGLLMGKITATGKFAPAIIGLTGKATTGSTQINCLTTAQATELARRQGASGTFKLTGPPTAGGTVRTATVTYSSIGGGSAANEVQTVSWDVTPTGGTFTITARKSDGTDITTAAIAFGATCSTTVTNALNALLGTSAVAVTASSSTTADNGFYITFSGTGYLALEQPMVTINSASLTSATTVPVATFVETTKGVPAANTITVTATSVNEVQRVTFAIASTGGNVAITYTDPTTGGLRTTGPAAWNATDSTYLSAINAALDLATGVSGGIVATAASQIDTDLGFVLTFSGTGYAGLPHPLVFVSTLPTSSTSSVVTRTTAGVDGRFAKGSLIQPTDGSCAPLFPLVRENGTDVTDMDGVSIDQPLMQYLRGADLIAANIVNLTEGDASVQTWLKAQLKSVGFFTFDNDRV